jgi:hypothetical protein
MAIGGLMDCSTAYNHPGDMRGKVRGVGPTCIERYDVTLFV